MLIHLANAVVGARCSLPYDSIKIAVIDECASLTNLAWGFVERHRHCDTFSAVHILVTHNVILTRLSLVLQLLVFDLYITIVRKLTMPI